MSVIILYEGGFGGKKANFAAIEEITPSISLSLKKKKLSMSICYEEEDGDGE